MRILLADDHQLVRQTIATYLRAKGHEMEQAGSYDEVKAVLRRSHSFDLLMLDYMMPGMAGFEGVKDVIAIAPQTPVAIITGASKPNLAREVIALGAKGFLPKTMSMQSLSKAIIWISMGEVYLPAQTLDVDGTSGANMQSGLGLSDKEFQVLRHVADGRANKEIALAMGLQEVTIKMHVKSILRKLGAKNRTHAAMIARDMQLV